MQTPHSLKALLVAGILAAGLAACQKSEQAADGKGPAQQVGEQVDKATAKAGEQLKELGSKAGEKMQEAGKDLQGKADEAKKKE